MKPVSELEEQLDSYIEELDCLYESCEFGDYTPIQAREKQQELYSKIDAVEKRIKEVKQN